MIHIHRTEKGNGRYFAQIDKEMLQDLNLSWQEKGVMCYLMSLPDDWEIRVMEIATHSANKRDALVSIFKSLIKKGYLVRRQDKNTKYRFMKVSYDAFETRSLSGKLPDSENTATGKSVTGESATGKTVTTNIEDTNKDNTNIENTKKREEEALGGPKPLSSDAIVLKPNITSSMNRGISSSQQDISVQCPAPAAATEDMTWWDNAPMPEKARTDLSLFMKYMGHEKIKNKKTEELNVKDFVAIIAIQRSRHMNSNFYAPSHSGEEYGKVKHLINKYSVSGFLRMIMHLHNNYDDISRELKEDIEITVSCFMGNNLIRQEIIKGLKELNKRSEESEVLRKFNEVGRESAELILKKEKEAALAKTISTEIKKEC